MAHKEEPWHSLLAGATAGAVEGFVTYPTEFVKTSSQFGGQVCFTTKSFKDLSAI
ncbi:hypothetical protein FS842_010217 [Serendipita sp. 407]|nr:hypothetical protein FS842_010217 [Serendipita sp. 407]